MTTQITTAAGTDVGVDIDGDDALARRAATDLRAFSPLYTRHVDRVYRYLRSRGQAPEDAADLTAVAFERAIVGIRRYESRGAGFAAWILRIARNAAIDAERRRRPTAGARQWRSMTCRTATTQPRRSRQRRQRLPQRNDGNSPLDWRDCARSNAMRSPCAMQAA